MMPVMCLLGRMFMPVYRFRWTHVLPRPYSNAALHLTGYMVLLPLALQRWWRNSRGWLSAQDQALGA